MSRRDRRSSRVAITANFTPLVDVALLLLIFFILVTHLSQRQRAGVQLPRPRPSAASAAEERRRVVVDLVSQSEDPTRLGLVVAAGSAHQPDGGGRAALAMQLATLYRNSPELRLDVRADRRLQYQFVEPVLRSIAEGASAAGATPRINLVVERE
jgi:biopolymer transport protein ExbD